MQVILGILYHTIGGISSGSFYMGFKKSKVGLGKVCGLLVDCFRGSLCRRLPPI